MASELKAILFFGLAAAVFVSGRGARADEIPNVLPPPDHGARTLRGHTFIEPATQDTPFITSHVGLRLGAFYVGIPSFPLSERRRADLKVFGLTERFDLALRLAPWLGIFFASDGSIATGLDQYSLVYGESAFSVGARGGAAVRLYRSRASGTQITVRGYGGGAYGNALTLPGLFQAVAVRVSREATVPVTTAAEAGARASRAVEDLSSAAVADASLARFGGSAHLAQTIVSMVGLQASFNVERLNAVDERIDPAAQARLTTRTQDTTVRSAVALGVDAYHIKVPVAVLLEYAVEKTFRSVQGDATYVPSTHYLGAGIFYSGRTDLQLGVSAFTRRNLKAQEVIAIDGTRATTEQPIQLYGQFVLRYIWN